MASERKRQNLDKASAVDSGGAGGARANPEFGGSEKGQSLLSAYRSLGLGVTPGFKKQSTVLNSVLPDLPQEVWCIIFAYLPTKSRKNATSTCKFWFEIIRGDSRFSGNISISWIELQNSSFDWDNWPSLKYLAISDVSFPSPNLALEAMKDIDFKKCQSLEKVTFGVNFDVAELSKEITTTATNHTKTKKSTVIVGENPITETENISTVRNVMRDIGTVLALVFNPKLDIEFFKLEHLDKLEIHMRHLQKPAITYTNMSSKTSDIIKRAHEDMKILGEAAKSIRWLIVSGKSFYHPEFFETGFKNFDSSLKVFTLEKSCFKYQHGCDFDYINSVNIFLKSLNENYPNLTSLNIGIPWLEMKL